LLRRMNVFVAVALADLHKELEPHYSAIGRPWIDPELHINPPAAPSKKSTTAVHAISTHGALISGLPAGARKLIGGSAKTKGHGRRLRQFGH